MSIKSASTALLFLLTVSTVHGEKYFRPEGYHYYKEIKPASGQNLAKENPSEYGVLPLDDEITGFGKSTDIRIVMGKKVLPYFIRGMMDHDNLKKVRPEIIYTRKTKNGFTYVLQLPPLPADNCYRTLEARSDENFESSVYVQDSGNLKSDWNQLGQRSLFQYNEEKQNQIFLDCTENRFIRLEFDSSVEFTFPSAEYSKKENTMYSLNKMDISDIKISKNSDQMSTRFYINNPHKKRISRLLMSFEQPRYHRNFEIYRKYFSEKEYVFFMRGVLSGEETRNNLHFIDFPDICDDSFRIEIFNDDNPPLTIKEFSIVSPREEIVFQIPPERDWPEQEARLRIYYGNSYAHRPSYDIQTTYDSDANHMRFSSEPHTENAEFAYSVIEPPVSIWIIRMLFAAGFLLTAVPGFLVFRRYASDMNKRPD